MTHNWIVEADLWTEVATSCFGGIAISCSYWGSYPELLFEVATSIIIIIMMMINNIVNFTPFN